MSAIVSQFEIGGVLYQARRLNAKQQFHVGRRLTPLLPKLMPHIGDLMKMRGVKMETLDEDMQRLAPGFEALSSALSGIPDEEADYILFGLLDAILRADGGGSWSPIRTQGHYALQYQDIGLAVMMKLAWEGLSYNFSDFTEGLKLAFGKDSPIPNSP